MRDSGIDAAGLTPEDEENADGERGVWVVENGIPIYRESGWGALLYGDGMRKVLLQIAVIGGMVFSSPKDSLNSGLLYGNNHAYWLSAPKGWVLDNESGKSDGLRCVFYPSNSSWRDSKIVAYTNISNKDAHINSISDQVSFTLTEFRNKNSGEIKAKIVDSLMVEKGKRWYVYEYSGDRWGNWERVGYLDEGKAIVMVILSSRDEKLYKENQGKFREILGSYSWMTDYVNFKDKK